jgi:hypothetical protein
MNSTPEDAQVQEDERFTSCFGWLPSFKWPLFDPTESKQMTAHLLKNVTLTGTRASTFDKLIANTSKEQMQSMIA